MPREPGDGAGATEHPPGADALLVGLRHPQSELGPVAVHPDPYGANENFEQFGFPKKPPGRDEKRSHRIDRLAPADVPVALVEVREVA